MQLTVLFQRRLYFIVFSTLLYLTLWIHYSDKALILSIFWTSILFHLRGAIAYYGVALTAFCSWYFQAPADHITLFFLTLLWQRWSEPMLYLNWQNPTKRLFIIFLPLIFVVSMVLKGSSEVFYYLYSSILGQIFTGFLNRHLPEGLKTTQSIYLKDMILFLGAYFCSEYLLLALLTWKTSDLLFNELEIKSFVQIFLRLFLLHTYTLSMPTMDFGIYCALFFISLPLSVIILGGLKCTQTLPTANYAQVN